MQNDPSPTQHCPSTACFWVVLFFKYNPHMSNFIPAGFEPVSAPLALVRLSPRAQEPKLGKCLSVVLLFWWHATLLLAAYTDPGILVKTVSTASNAHQPIVTLPTNGPAMVTLTALATNFTPTSYTWSQVADTFNSFATTGTATFLTTNASFPQVSVSLPTPGVYQFQVVATDGVNTVSRYAWVNVWDNVGAFNPNHQVGRNPGLLPPTSVRQLSLDPGPFCHPRVLFSRSDWPELQRKTANSSEVKLAVTKLQSSLAGNFDKAGSAMMTLINAYTNYAAGGYNGAYFTNVVMPAHTNSTGILNDLLIGHNPGGSYFDALVTACYLAWVGTDPALPHGSAAITNQVRFNYLATLVAASTKVEMNLNSTNPTAFYTLALCYDLVYDWMTVQQQNDTRDYLYAIGYGYNNTGGGGLSRTSRWDGYLQNGDFPNLADGVVLPELAIEGEEANVTATVQAAFGPTLPYATGATAWPQASPAAVNNLHRLMNWNTDWYVTPWGFIINMVDYFQLGQNLSAPAALALARRGEDQFTTTYYYQSSLAALYNLAPREDGKGMALFDHHDGLPFTPGPGQLNAAYIVKYMYPDDPMVDYVYRAFRLENENDLAQAIFASDPTNLNLAAVAQAKNLALTKLDPQRSVAVSRNTWGENDLNLIFENRFDQDGHMHAERNNFSLYALGRAWSSPPGYHCTINDLMASVLIQNPSLAGDPATAGYLGQSPSSATQTTNSGFGPPPPGKLVEITEDPAKQWTLFAGDASPAYNWALGTNNAINTGVTQLQNAYDGLASSLSPSILTSLTSTWSVQTTNYNSVLYALRSVLTVRGPNPYVLVIDDINKDGTPHNYRWSMPCAVSFGGSGNRFIDTHSNAVYSSLTNLPGATATETILYHLIDAGTNNQPGLPRLLVRDVTETSTAGQPPIFLDTRPSGYAGGNLTYGYDNNSKLFSYVPSSRIMIQRTNVIAPAFKVLLFPFRTGSNTPATAWSPDQSTLTIDQLNGTVDKFTFNPTNSDHRTRITSFARTLGHSAPAINLPANIIVNANAAAPNGQPGAGANFIVSATDYLGNALNPALSSPSGTIFPVGVNTVQVSAVDALGQQSSTNFTVTVIPSGPLVAPVAIENLASSGSGYGVTLSWPVLYGATGYNVKRSTSSGGPYVILSTNQAGPAFTDANLTSVHFFYVVTAQLNAYEGAPSSEVALSPNTTGPLILGSVGNAVGDGVYASGTNYLVTCSQGDIPGGNFSEQCTYLYEPWSGDGSFTIHLTSLYPSASAVSQFSKFGVMMRSSLVNNTTYAMAGYNTYVSPLFFQYRSVAGSTAGGASLFNYSKVYPPVWSRLVRAGTNFSAYYSYDGSTWTPIGSSTNLPLPANTLVGLAVAPQNTTPASATFDNVVFLGTPVLSTTASGVKVSWAGSVAAAFSVQRATNLAGSYATLAAGITSTNYVDATVLGGSNYYYLVTAIGTSGGLTTSPAVRITAAPVLLPAFTASVTNGSAPLTVVFTDTTLGTVTNHYWNFGDGATTNTSSTGVTHTFTTAGTKGVTLTVTGPGATNAVSLLVFVTAPPPVLGGLQFLGGQWVITGTNGTAGSNYLVLAATNLAIPASNWMLLATNRFGIGGGLVFTNPGDPDVPKMFFRLRLP